MNATVHSLGPTLSRAIILRQISPDQWRVEGYERQAGRWRFTWVLRPEDTTDRARKHAAWLARHTGLPVGEQTLGGRIRLISGILGRAA